MCGIAGFAGWTPDGGIAGASKTVRAMCDAIAHRGPDDDGYFVAPGIALGMRRLSIIDVSGGPQPTANEDGTLQVAFNGEIYNHHELRRELVARGHSFRTRSDTETIVHLYEECGVDFVRRLRGMFAIALWDAQQRRLVLARDRAGIKPLSYWQTADGLAFGSELRSLLTLPRFHRRLDERGIAAFLRGGLDSPTVVALMRGAAIVRRTFAIGFGESAFNEAPHARRVAESRGASHTDLVVSPAADRLVDGLVSIFDEPFADASALPTYYVSQLARRQVTVSLSGDGGDELFGGYTRYLDVLRRPRVPAWSRPVLRAVGRALPHIAPGRGRLLDLARARHAAYAGTVSLPLAPADGGMAAAALVPRDGQFGDLLADAFAEAGARDFVSQMMLVDVATYLPGDILTKVDRASMAVSLQARVPLLDHPLVEFALSLPAAFKIRDGTGKRVFRRAIRELVPPPVLDYPKLGFAVPLAAWFRGPLRHRLDQLARAGRLYTYIDRRALQRLAREHVLRRRDHSLALWRALVLELWLGHLDSGRLARPISRSLVDA